ncbi:MAG: Sec-independent protein translocase subunit TatA [Pseudonocardiaceae bacterium]
MGIPSGWELIVLLAVLVLLFGATKLPTAARSIGQSIRIFKAETKSARTEDQASPPTPDTQSLPPSAPVTTPAEQARIEESQRPNDTSR